MGKTPQDFYNKYNGRAIDQDGSYGVQCVDGFKVFDVWAGIPVKPTGNNYASGYWLNRKTNGYDKYFDYITDKSQVQRGDWCIWNNGSSCKNSHIAMYWSPYGSGKATFFGQRQDTEEREFRLTRLSTDFMGAFRWKQWSGNPYTKPRVILSEKNAAYKKKYGGTSGVKWIQWALDRLGLYKGKIDGYFGPETREAVKTFQKKNGLTADGQVGPITRQKLEVVM